jgi:hypothetical protein
MKEIIDQITAKAGITDEQAQQAFKVVIDNVSNKLPPSVSSQLDSVLTGKAFDYKAVMKERFDALKDDTEENIQEFAGELKLRFEEMGSRAEVKFAEVKKETEGFFRRIFGGGQK